ncbi:FAD-binding oxidoreductase [Candidatus Saccharibacteria bacterium]|nr:FAD-binding oxidoreductase [Candidatus Saccharibacteria bacterium]
MGKIAKYLNQLTIGNVFDGPEILEAYSTDRSALKIKPKFVAFPESTEDIQKLMRFFSQLAAKDIKVAITPRGGGRSEGGACLTNGIVISTQKLNKMLEIDPRERLVRVQSGITLKELNTALSVSGLTVPIEGHDDESIGGLISNCTIDRCAGKYGGIKNFVERVEVVLPNGDCLQTERYRKYALAKKAVEKTTEGEIYRKIAKVLSKNKDFLNELKKKSHGLAGYPKIVDVPVRESVDLMPLFFGAQGTLGIISEVIMRAVPLTKQASRVIATFKEIGPATEFANKIRDLNPRVLDLYDLKIIMEAKETGKNLDGIIRRLEDGFVVFASFDEKPASNLKKVAAMQESLPRNTKIMIEKDDNKNIFDEFENSLINYLSYVRHGERVPILTDFYLPNYNLENFLRDLKVLGEKLDIDLEVYGSFSTSIYNLRPKFDLEDEEFNKKATTFLKAGAFIIERQGGELAGGAPEGRLKAIVTNLKMPEAELNLYTEVKKILDPSELLNPDVKLGANSKFTLTHFRNTNQPKIMI